MPGLTSKNGMRPLAPAFAALFMLAHIGAFAACLPLLTMLVPLKASEISPDGKAALLSWTVLVGAAVASVFNIAGGALSDATRSKFGRRRPWLFGGAAGTIASYYFIWRAASPTELIAGVILFQIAFNIFLPALVVLLPDHVPDQSKGRMASLLALGPPAGLGAGALLAGSESLSGGGKYVALIVLATVLIAPLLLFWKEPAGAGVETAGRTETDPVIARNYRLVWLSRLLTQIAIATSQGFLLLFIVHLRDGGRGFPLNSAENLVSKLLLISTSVSIVTALIVGALSDRFGRRRNYVAASGGLICVGMIVVAFVRDWNAVIAGQLLYGLGFGLYSSAEVALAAETLPSRRNTARDLAILNLGNTLPQAISPIFALIFISPANGGYSTLFAIGALAAGIGGIVAMRIRTG